MNKVASVLIGALVSANTLWAAEVTVPIYSTTDKALLGNIVFVDTPTGLLITPNLSGLPAGMHGLHLHEHADCGDHGTAAGAHYDPAKTNKHLGPYGQGHLGDLPVMKVSDDGHAVKPTLAPHLKLADLKGLSVMIHANGDNYSDKPPLGGGGAREACGVVTMPK